MVSAAAGIIQFQGRKLKTGIRPCDTVFCERHVAKTTAGTNCFDGGAR